jgi:cytochrome c oxidase assembly factor CtaG
MGGGPSLVGSWSLEPLQLAPVAAGAVLYWRRASTLRHRGPAVAVPTRKVVLFTLGLFLIAVGLASPLEAFAEEQFFFAHMAQHVLLGDLAPLCLVAGLTGPMLRPVLALRPVERLRGLAHPLVALPLWAVNLYIWHLPVLYEGALHHDSLHALQHLLFLVCGALMWAPVIETLPAPLWFGTAAKLGYVTVVRLVQTVLGNVFLFAGTVFYPFYEHGVDRFGISPHDDQALAGAVMMGEGSIVTVVALVALFLRLAREGELRQELVERGFDPESARRAVRYGRDELVAGGRS